MQYKFEREIKVQPKTPYRHFECPMIKFTYNLGFPRLVAVQESLKFNASLQQQYTMQNLLH